MSYQELERANAAKERMKCLSEQLAERVKKLDAKNRYLTEGLALGLHYWQETNYKLEANNLLMERAIELRHKYNSAVMAGLEPLKQSKELLYANSTALLVDSVANFVGAKMIEKNKKEREKSNEQKLKSVVLAIASASATFKDAASSVKNTVTIKAESIANKKLATVLLIAAKAQLAMTAAKPIVGPIMAIASKVATIAAIAGMIGAVRSASIPGLATGGVVSAPTMALVGEGRYPEAVVPLGNSPQFASMKNDIAAAVVQGVSSAIYPAMYRALTEAGSQGQGNNGQVISIQIDSEELLRAVVTESDRQGTPLLRGNL